MVLSKLSFSRVGKEGGTDYVFDPSARGSSESCPNKDAGPSTIPDAGEGGRGGGQEDQGWPLFPGNLGLCV